MRRTGVGVMAVLLGCQSVQEPVADDGDVRGDADSPGAPDTAAPDMGGLKYGYFAIHLDPGADPGDGNTPSSLRPERYFTTLTDMVVAADAHGHKLTMMFTAQWGHHLGSSDCVVPAQDSMPSGAYEYNGVVHRSCLELVRAFEAGGHEVALHHHPLGAPASWDGFTNDFSALSSAQRGEYLGTVDDLLTTVSAIPLGGQDSIRAGTLEEFPASAHAVRFTGARGPTPYVSASERGDLASIPCSWKEDDSPVWRFRMRSLGEDALTELDRAAVDLVGSGTEYTVGFVTHAIDAAGPDGVPYERLYAQLDEAGIALQPLSEVGALYGYTARAPEDDREHACPEDEGLSP